MTDQTRSLKYMPVAFFAVIMGCLGLTLAWQKSALILAVPHVVSDTLLLMSLMIALAIVISYLLKLIRYREQVKAEFNHPIKLSFFPAFSIGVILFSVATLEQFPVLSELLWWVGSAIQLVFTLNALTRWIHHPSFQIGHSTPAWFIPVVGNILVPVAGVQHGHIELSWFFFSFGLIFWLVLKTLIFNRLIFHDPMPQKLMPTLFIFIAPPAVGFISYLQLNGGELDGFARLLFYFAAFMVLLLLSQINRFRRIRFYMSWWAYSFPIAAFTINLQLMYQLTGITLFYYVSWLALLLVSALILLLAVKTIQAIVSAEIFEAD